MTGSQGQDWASYQSATPSTAGLSFAFCKVTEGTGYVNPKWVSQRDHAKAAGLVWGAYHYPHMANDPHKEADYFLDQVAWKLGDIIVLDWEGYDTANAGISGARKLAYRDSWLSYVKGKMPHNPVGMYCNTDYWLNLDETSNTGDFLWIATAGKPAGSPGIEYNWLFHQYSTSGGIDHDYCHLTSTELHAWALSFGQVDAPPVKTPSTPTAKKVSLKNLIAAAKADPSAKQGHTTHPADVKIYEAALKAEKLLASTYASDGSFGTTTIKANAAWQKAYSKAHNLGWSGADVNGIPGKTSATALGKKHGFTVVA